MTPYTLDFNRMFGVFEEVNLMVQQELEYQTQLADENDERISDSPEINYTDILEYVSMWFVETVREHNDEVFRAIDLVLTDDITAVSVNIDMAKLKELTSLYGVNSPVINVNIEETIEELCFAIHNYSYDWLNHLYAEFLNEVVAWNVNVSA